MPYTVGRCVKVDYCSLAQTGRDVMIGAGEGFFCPECNAPLKAVALTGGASTKPSLMPFLLLAGGIIVAGTMAALLLRPGAAPVSAQQVQPTLSPQLALAQVPAPAPTPAAEAVHAAPPPQAAPAQSVLWRISGVNAMSLQLAPRLVATFLANAGDTDISTVSDPATRTDTISGLRGQAREAVTITTRTARDAFRDMASGAADIVLSSRRVTQQEHDALSALGDLTAPESEHILALDAIAIVVNPANKLGQINAAQLRAIYSGAVQDWSQLGGNPGPIDVWGRIPGSGTRDTFIKFALGSTPPRPIDPGRISDDDGPIVAAVDADRGAIAYISQANIGAARALAVAEGSLAPLLPTPANIATEEYPLTRRFYLYTASAPKNPFVARFTQYAESAAGQELVSQAGFVSLTIKASAVQAAAAADPFHLLVAGAQRLTVDFHFKSGSNSLDNLGLRDLDRVADLITANHWDEKRLILVGFADNTGAPAANAAIAKERADAVAAIFANRGIVPGTVQAFGGEVPVADNATPEGRDKNRRVEMYVRPDG